MRAYFADGQAVEAAPGDTGREKSRGDSRRCGLLPVPRLAPGGVGYNQMSTVLCF